MANRWWVRIGVVVATVVSGLTWVVAPATAGGSDGCARAERAVYGITTSGGLVQHAFCLDDSPSGHLWLDSTTVADSGWDDTAYSFWSGATGSPGVIYRVSAPTGALSWANRVTGP